MTATTRILLVTGSRALNDTALATCWTADRLAKAFDAFNPTIVVHGDAIGADRSADVLAQSVNIPRMVFTLRGTVEWRGGKDLGLVGMTWCPLGVTAHPLARNRAMVTAVEATVLLRKSCDAKCLALTAPWAKTQGTMFTASRAVEAGIDTWVETCPAAYGPKATSAYRG